MVNKFGISRGVSPRETFDQVAEIAKVAEDNATIANLRKENEDLTDTVKAQQKTITDLRGRVNDLEQQLENARQDIANVSHTLKETEEYLQQAIDVARTPFINGWVYDHERGWLFTDADHYPLVYSHSTQSWYYYELGSTNPRFFYSFADEQWEAWDPMPEETTDEVFAQTDANATQN